MAKDRETRIPEEGTPVPPGWTINGEPVRVDVDDNDALAEAVYAATQILRYVGGVVQMTPVRRELGPEVYVTTEYVFKWNSFVPPVREPQPPKVEVPELQEEPALAAVE